MPNQSNYYSFIHVWNEPIFWDYEYINWITVENQLKGLFTFTGSGIVDGWQVLSVLESEIDELSDDIKEDLEHTNYCMIFKVSSGDGVIGVYAAYTPDTVYKAIPIEAESKIYYVYAVATDCLPKKHRADILLISADDGGATYDSNHSAVYLSTIITYYDPTFEETYIYRIYDENYRRRTLKNLSGPSLEAMREAFLRHKHLGSPTTEFQVEIENSPSKISLDLEDIEELFVVPSSTIFLINEPFYLIEDLEDDEILSIRANYPIYEKVDVRVNGITLTKIIDYYLDNIAGKLYLKNSINSGDILQVVKYRNPSETQIARGPQDDPSSTLRGDIPVVTGDDKYIVHNDYKLPKNRVGDIDASKIVSGILPINRINSINHYGMKRIRESAILNPRVLTRTRDQQTYYVVPPENVIIGYDTEIFTSFNSKFIGNVISIVSGLYRVNDDNYQDLTKYSFPDDRGRIIKIYDNNIEGDNDGGSQFLETYVLTDEGEIWYTVDNGNTWELLDIPSYTDIFVNCFTVSTDKVERIVKNFKTWDYYKVYHLGTNFGLFTARFLAAKGTLTGETVPVETGVIPWILDLNRQNMEIFSLQEIITGHSYVTEEFSSYWYDRTLYIGTENGFYIGNKIVDNADNIIVKDILWVLNNSALLALDNDNKVYITHTFEHIQKDDGNVAEDYWKHPLSDTGEELHVSYTFYDNITSRLSQEFGRRKYFIGLDKNLAISNLDNTIGSIEHHPFLKSSITTIDTKYGLCALNGKAIINGTYGSGAITSKIKVLSLANVADQLTRSDAEKEIADGWNPLVWDIPTTYMENTNIVSFKNTSITEYGSIFGGEQQPTDYFVTSYNGIWKSKNGGQTWEHPVLIWDNDVIPYIERNGIEVPISEYSLNHILQAIIFKNIQSSSDNILVEYDFKEYYAVNGKWEQDNADVAVYINNELASIPYTYDMLSGKFIFNDKLTKTANVTFSLIDVGTYITDIGTNPHSEVLDAFVKNDTVYTELTSDITTEDMEIKVFDTTNFPIIPHYLQIENEKFYVKKIDKYTFKIIQQRTNPILHIKGENVYWLEVKRQYGIDDYISISTSGQTYNIFSLYVANLLRGQMSWGHIYEDIFDSIRHNPPDDPEDTVYEGSVQSLICIGGQDEFDDASSISTLWNGLDIPSRIDVATPQIISFMLNPNSSSFTAGSDKGVWRFNGVKWDQLSNLDNSSFVYYIAYDRRDYLIVGADNGLWTSVDDGISWSQSSTLYEEQLSFLKGSLSWWSTSKNYEIYGKNNGLSIIVYGWDEGIPESFHSDHFDPVDGSKVFGFYQGSFFRIDEDTGQKETFDSLIVMSEVGLYLCYSGIRYYKNGEINPYSSILKGVEPIDPGYRTESNIDDISGETITTVISGIEGDLSKDQRYIKVDIDNDGQPVYEKLKFFGAFQDSRQNTVPLIFLTNDGLRVVRNWRWVDPENLTIYFHWEAMPLSISNDEISSSSDHEKRVICNCFTTGKDNSIDDDDERVWKKYKCFVGTNQGIYRSYNGCYNVEPCQKIPNISYIYSLYYDDDIGRLFAGTNNGWWYSDNDGDDWSQPIVDISNVDYIQSGVLISQTFIPEYNKIDKVGLYLHPKR